jgi:peptidyl-prolyl cis-trans isomerase C
VCLVLCLLVAISACSKSSEKEAPAAGSTATATPNPDGASPRPGEPTPPPAAAFVKPVPAELPAVIARINGEDVRRGDLEKLLENYQRENGPLPPTERDQVVRNALDYLIGLRLLLQESQSRKLAVPDAEIEERVAMIRKQFPTEEAFKKELAAQKATLEQVRTETRQELLVARLLEAEVGPKMAVSAEDVEKAYTDNPQAFQTPDEVRASHILIAFPPDADAAAKAGALARAESVLKSARGGKDFAALAKEFSQDPGSAVKGGDLDFFNPAEMVPPFRDAASTLKPGVISDLVETQYGYHIIKVTGRRAGRKVSLDEARGQIEQRLQMTNRDRYTQEFVNGLRQKAKVEVFI